MKAMASVDESAEPVLRGRRILELAAEEDEANSVVFPGGVLHETMPLYLRPHLLLGSGRGLLVVRLICGILSLVQ